MTYQRGTFLNWKSGDENGSFEVDGQVVSHKDGMIAFNLWVGGQYNIPEDDGTFTVISKPRNWTGPDLLEKEPTKTSHKPTKRRTPRTKGGPTKADQVKQLLEERPELLDSRAAAIQVIMDEIGMTKAGASTYFQNVRKEKRTSFIQ